MDKERYIEHYKGHQVVLYGTDDKLWWKVTLPQDESKLTQQDQSFTTPRTFLSQDTAIDDAKRFIDNFIPHK